MQAAETLEVFLHVLDTLPTLRGLRPFSVNSAVSVARSCPWALEALPISRLNAPRGATLARAAPVYALATGAASREESVRSSVYAGGVGRQ
jgi:hypothetical protein